MSREGSGSVRAYAVGLVASVVLTLVAYGLTRAHVESGHAALAHSLLIPGLLGLAVVQFGLQLVFFLHLGREARPRWNVTVFGFMVLVLVILVVGSLWIMGNLNYHMLPAGTNGAIMHDEGIH